jgi:hypothetical protein
MLPMDFIDSFTSMFQPETFRSLARDTLCAYSGGIRTGVPIQFGHPFRLNPDSDSDSNRTGVPILFGQRFRNEFGQDLVLIGTGVRNAPE